jgi:hypothetical protein
VSPPFPITRTECYSIYPRPEDGSEDAKKAWHEVKHFYALTLPQVRCFFGELGVPQKRDPRRIRILQIEESAVPLDDGTGSTGLIRTLHRYGAPSLFKPSIFEVLAQLPPWSHDRDLVAAFKTECSTRPTSEWTDIECEAMNAGFHLAYTTLYARKAGYYLKNR